MEGDHRKGWQGEAGSSGVRGTRIWPLRPSIFSDPSGSRLASHGGDGGWGSPLQSLVSVLWLRVHRPNCPTTRASWVQLCRHSKTWEAQLILMR